MAVLGVEVFPIARDRWVAVVETADGPFSTEAVRPEDVEVAVRTAVTEVLGAPVVDLALRDDLGRPWSPAAAAGQLARLVGD